MIRFSPSRWRMCVVVTASALMSVGACSDTGLPFGGAGARSAAGDVPAQVGPTRLVERDVEAPDIFQVTEAGLWDGRPSLGGVWVAHPAAQDPERVIIRNEENGRFVIGALFRRDHGNPGPAMMISSDAAAALNILAGDPTTVQVTALRREPLPDPVPPPAATATDAPPPGDTPQAALRAPQSIAATPLGDPTAAAAAALSRAEIVAGIASAGPAAQAVPAAATRSTARSAAAPGGVLARPYLQVGIFSTRENAASADAALRNAGLVPTIHDQTINGRRAWRVVAGPAGTTAERDEMLRIVQGLGFADAFATGG